MRRLSFFTLSLYIIVLPLANSKYMYSFEGKEVCIEKFDINHILKTSFNNYSSFKEDDNFSFSPNRQICHSHATLKTAISNNHFDILDHIKNLTSIDFHPSNKNLYSSV